MQGTTKAFVLGAGLGTRLRPLTDRLPKPLVPVWNRPLLTCALDHLIEDLGAGEFLVNTHHCPEAYEVAFPDGTYRDRSLQFRHEPVLLDTAGGIDNIRDWLPADESFVVYNGDILTDLPLGAAWERHRRSGALVTMVLRSSGDELRVGFDPETESIVDLRGVLRPDWTERFQFTGIYFVHPRFLDFLERGKIESVVFPILRAIEAGEQVSGHVADEGTWSDLGERGAYLDALAHFAAGFRGRSGDRISDSATIESGAEVDSLTSIGERVTVEAGARIEQSVIWSDATIRAGAVLKRSVVMGGEVAEGEWIDQDLGKQRS